MGFKIVDLNNVPSATVVATSSATGFPASRMAVKTPPYVRGWRSTSTGAQTLTFTFSGSTSVVGCLLYDVNFTSVTIGGTGRTVTADSYDSIGSNRYKLWVEFSATASSQVVVIGSQTPTDGASYFKVGKVHFFTAYTELQQNPRPEMPITIIDPQLIAGEEDGAVYESYSRGPAFIVEEWDWLGADAYMTELFTTGKIGRHQPFILYHNLGSGAEAYYMQRIGEMSIQRGNNIQGISTTFRQIP